MAGAGGIALGTLDAELFPTEVRSTSNAMLYVIGVVGSASWSAVGRLVCRIISAASAARLRSRASVVARRTHRRAPAPGIGGAHPRRRQPELACTRDDARCGDRRRRVPSRPMTPARRSGPRRPGLPEGPTLARRTPVVLRSARQAGRRHEPERRGRDDRRRPRAGRRDSGWLPDGRLLVVSMIDRSVMRLEADGAFVVHADLAEHGSGRVQRHGRRRNRSRGTSGTSASTCTRATHRTARASSPSSPTAGANVAAEGLEFPNGSIITDDGRDAARRREHGGPHQRVRHRRRRHAVEPAGVGAARRRDRRRHVPRRGRRHLGRLPVHGARACECWRAARSSTRSRERIPERSRACSARDDRTTLYMCTAPTHEPEEARVAHGGRIEAVEVDVDGAGLPSRRHCPDSRPTIPPRHRRLKNEPGSRR